MATDRPRAEEAIRAVYYHSGRDDAIEFLWFESLPAMRLAYSVLRRAQRPSDRALEAQAGLPQPILAGLLRRARSRRTPVNSRTSLKCAFERPLLRLVEALAPLSQPFDAPIPSAFDRLAPELVALRMDAALAVAAWRCRTELMPGPSAPCDVVLSACLTASESCLWWCPFEKVVLLCDRPLEKRRGCLRCAPK